MAFEKETQVARATYYGQNLTPVRLPLNLTPAPTLALNPTLNPPRSCRMPRWPSARGATHCTLTLTLTPTLTLTLTLTRILTLALTLALTLMAQAGGGAARRQGGGAQPEAGGLP